MELTLEITQISDLAWGTTTKVEHQTLVLNAKELEDVLCQSDSRIKSVEVELAQAGESCRIGPVFDVEPRAKLDGASDFPGAIGPITAVGTGRTSVLRGAAVTILNTKDRPSRRPTVLDLAGSVPAPEGSAVPTWRLEQLVVYASLQHVVLIPRLVAGLTDDQASNVFRLAVLRAAAFLARQCAGNPTSVETLSLPEAQVDLPRIVYVYQVHSHQRPTVTGEPLIYGDNARHLVPTVLHPLEILDGAALPGYGRDTYKIQNHPVVLNLLERHGKELNFVGVVVVVAHMTAEERTRGAVVASNIVSRVLKADGAVFTKTGGGAPHVDMAEMAHRCELQGVKTSLVAWDVSDGSGVEDTDEEDTALFNYADLNAVANVGPNSYRFRLSPVERVICPWPEGDVTKALAGVMTVTSNGLVGVLDALGGERWTTVRY